MLTDPELRKLADSLSQVLRPHLERSEPLRAAVGLIGRWLADEAARAAETEPSAGASEPTAADVAGAVVPEAARQHARDFGQSQADLAEERASGLAEAGNRIEKTIAPTGGTALPQTSGTVLLRLGNASVHLPVSGTAEELGRARQSASEPHVKASDAKAAVAKTADAALRQGGFAGDELQLIIKRCELKRKSCWFYIQNRLKLSSDGKDYETVTKMQEMIAEAKTLPNCFLWVFWPKEKQPDDSTLLMIAENYRALVAAADLMRRIDASSPSHASDDCQNGLNLLAEAKASLRAALTATWLTTDDRDQSDVHNWLREQTVTRRVFLSRYMTAETSANPAETSDLISRIAAIGHRLDHRAKRETMVKAGLNRIRYHAGLIVKNTKGGDQNSEPHWRKIAETAKALVKSGVIVVTDRRLAEAVGPEAAAMWAADKPGAEPAFDLSPIMSTIRAIANEALGSQEEDDETDEHPGQPPTEAVLKVRGLLRGKRMVIIGGERRVTAVESLMQAFELADVEWVPLVEHGPGGAMKAPICRPDTAVVVVLKNLAGHQHGDDAKDYCETADKPCVMVVAGYNKNRIAQDILGQASIRLGGPLKEPA